MHAASMELMTQFAAKLPAFFGEDRRLRVLDVGARDVQGGAEGNYRKVFSAHQYTGMDIEAGDNVDLVVRDGYDWQEIPDRSFDVIISGQAFEHMLYPWLAMKQIAKKLAPGGYACVIAPSNGFGEHRFPIDCYRYFPDGLSALGTWAKLECVESMLQGLDCFAVYKHPAGDHNEEEAVKLAPTELLDQGYRTLLNAAGATL